MHKSLVLTEALSIPEKINYLASNDYNNYNTFYDLKDSNNGGLQRC